MPSGKEVVQMMDGQWHKIAALLMLKQGIDQVVITASDIQKLSDKPSSVVVRETDAGLTISVMGDLEAKKLALRTGDFHIKG